MNTPHFILATSSKYKIQVFEKLGIPFRTLVPDIDESPLLNEGPSELVARLSAQKALKALELDNEQSSADNLYIGIDQVATFNNQIIGKSHTVEKAIAQLESFSGNSVTFLTGISVVNNARESFTQVEPFEVKFKSLSRTQIEKYVASEMPLDCAGSFKSEGQGILLFDDLAGRDINSLVGMPLIAFQELCFKFDIDLFELL